MEDEKLREIQ
jgi:hypothetical protein